MLLTSDLYLSNYGYFNTTSWESFKKEHDFVSDIKRSKDTGRYVVTPVTHQQFKLFPEDKLIMDSSFAALYGVYTVGGSEVLRIANYDIILNMLSNTKSLEEAKRFFDIMGVRYIIANYDIAEKGFKFLKSVKVDASTVYLHEYETNAGRFMIFNKASYVKDDKAVIEKLLDKQIDLRKELILLEDEKDGNEVRDDKNNMPGDYAKRNALVYKTRLVSYKANKVVLECETNRDAFFYMSDAYYPGWKAYIDGKEVRIYRANLAFRAIKIPKGIHQVLFRYIPFSFYFGLFLTIIGVILSACLIRKQL